MYFILMYDVNEKRVAKALKTCRRYLTWVQNSVFEGELSKAQYEKLKVDLKKVLNLEEDSVIIYELRDERYSNREVIGISKNEVNSFF
ncbi:MAG: CRISPR-associated endonuclease Cas2 [Brevinematales bacterium]